MVRTYAASSGLSRNLLAANFWRNIAGSAAGSEASTGGPPDKNSGLSREAQTASDKTIHYPLATIHCLQKMNFRAIWICRSELRVESIRPAFELRVPLLLNGVACALAGMR